MDNNFNKIQIQRVCSPDKWIKKFWENYKRAISVSLQTIIICPKCRRSPKRVFHKEGKFRCSYCGYKGYANLNKI